MSIADLLIKDKTQFKEGMLEDHSNACSAAQNVNYNVRSKVAQGMKLGDALDSHEAEVDQEYSDKKQAIKDLRKKAKE